MKRFCVAEDGAFQWSIGGIARHNIVLLLVMFQACAGVSKGMLRVRAVAIIRLGRSLESGAGIKLRSNFLMLSSVEGVVDNRQYGKQ